jgi:hypothetical protein
MARSRILLATVGAAAVALLIVVAVGLLLRDDSDAAGLQTPASLALPTPPEASASPQTAPRVSTSPVAPPPVPTAQLAIQSSREGGDSPEVQLWRTLRDYLDLTIEVDSHAREPGDNTEVDVRFIVTNLARDRDDWPRIVFEEIRIEDRGSGGLSGVSFSELANGDSATTVREVSYQNLPKMELELTASIAWESFTAFSGTVIVPLEHTRSTAWKYLLSFNRLAVHSPLDGVLAAVKEPESGTTVGEMQKVSESLDRCVTQTEQLKSLIEESPYRLLGRRGDRHAELTYRYLDELKAACTDTRSVIVTADPDRISSAISELRQTMSAKGDEVDDLTEAMMADYDLSDRETEYRYRDDSRP